MTCELWTETELVEGSEAFLKAASSLPGRIIAVTNGVASVGGIDVAIDSIMFKRLISAGCVRKCDAGYEVLKFGNALVGQ